VLQVYQSKSLNGVGILSVLGEVGVNIYSSDSGDVWLNIEECKTDSDTQTE
jgi:hypothetical protein